MKIMTNEKVLKHFESATNPNTFSRVDSTHPLDIFLGLDSYGKYTLLLVCDKKYNSVSSTELIASYVMQRKDDKWAFSLSLNDPYYKDIFCDICSDLITTTEEITDKDKGNSFFLNRYDEWIRLLKRRSSGILSDSEIKGLIGELVFMRDCLVSNYGIDVAINSWIGPEHADQDFVCPDIWYEVKSTVSGTAFVSISSVEQLDTKNDGELIVVYLDKTSKSDSHKITLNDLVIEIKSLITSELIKEKLESILLSQGYYYREEYDEYCFKLTSIDSYHVRNEFPCLRKTSIPNGITRVKYDLLLDNIQQFKERKY